MLIGDDGGVSLQMGYWGTSSTVSYVYPYGRGHQIIIAVCLGNKCFPEVLCLWRDPGCELLAIAADFHD